MTSLSGLLDLTRTALAADQAALNTTATNVANQNTPGYSTQVATFSAGDTVWISAGGAQASQGPQFAAISSRDRVLDQRIQQQTQTQAGTSAEADVLSQLEAVFSITGSTSTAGSTQLGTALNQLFSSFSALSSSPADTSARQGVLSAVSTVAAAFESAASGLAAIQTSIEAGVASSVSDVNGLTKTIAGLNAEIAASSPTRDAGTLEDQRQVAITKLSALIGVNQALTQSNGIDLSATDGTVLVSGSQSYSLHATVVNNSSGRGVAEVLNSSGQQVTLAAGDGSLGGRLAGQNQDVPTVQTALDNLAYRVANAFNVQNTAGTTPSGVAGGDLFIVSTTQNGAAGSLKSATTDPKAVAAGGPGEGSLGNSNANALAAIAQQTDASGRTILDDLASLLSGVGTISAGLQQQNTVQQASLTQLTTQQSALSGVNLDTEAANLTRYQRSYQAAAQVLTVIDKLFAAALNLGVQTAVS